MKTNELIDKLTSQEVLTKYIDKDNIFELNRTNNNTIWNLVGNGKSWASLSTIGSWISVHNDCPKEIALWLLDYVKTPLEEREEEKKYYLRFPKGYNRWYSYLAKETNKDNGEYDCSGKCIDNETYKNIFTQKEIDAMPFDTNFFIKEEVV